MTSMWHVWHKRKLTDWLSYYDIMSVIAASFIHIRVCVEKVGSLQLHSLVFLSAGSCIQCWLKKAPFTKCKYCCLRGQVSQMPKIFWSCVCFVQCSHKMLQLSFVFMISVLYEVFIRPEKLSFIAFDIKRYVRCFKQIVLISFRKGM